MNLVIVQCGLNNRNAALTTLTRILEFAPDDQKAGKLLEEIRSDGRKCETR